MTATPPPTVCRYLIKDTLEGLRSAKDLKRTDVAPLLGCSPQKVSHHETGRTVPNFLELRRYFEVYEATEEQQTLLSEWATGAKNPEWFEEYRPPKRQAVYFGLETGATQLWEAESDLVPGLLQTFDYARELLRTFGGRRSDRLNEQWAELRLRRQQRLTSSTNPLRLHAVVSEVALLRCVRQQPQVGRGQLEYLLERMELPTVTLQVLPLGGFDTAMGSPLIILQFPSDVDDDGVCLSDVAWTEYHLGGHTWQASDVVDELKARWAQAQEAALDEDQTSRFIRNLLGEMDG